jgi:MFS family permease
MRAPAAPASVPDQRAWIVVAVLMLAYTFAYIDRTLLALLVKPIRATLHISDVQLSLLSGLAFALFYTCLGIPIGRLIDHRSRRRIIAAAIGIWSVMTALCGVSHSFGQLFLARVGVGVGEAALSPAAYSMLADLFSPASLPRALSLYSASIYVGSGLALIGGGALIGVVPPVTLPFAGTLAPWQLLFIIAGLPGLLIALLVLRLREPRRLNLDAALAGASLATGLRFLWQQRGAYGFLIGGYTVASLLWNGCFAWLPSFFVRNHGWSLTQTGLVLGCILLACGAPGIMLGGVYAGRLRARGDRGAGLKVGIISAAIVLPCGVLLPFVPVGVAIALICGFVLAGSMPYGAAAAALQDITPNQLRGQVSAIYLFGLNIAGIGFGPTVVAFLSQHLFHSDRAIGLALSLTTAIAAPCGIVLLSLGLAPYRRIAGIGLDPIPSEMIR